MFSKLFKYKPKNPIKFKFSIAHGVRLTLLIWKEFSKFI